MKDKDGNEYTERIRGYIFLTGKCSTCGSPNVVIRVNSHRQYANPRIMSGEHGHDYCVEHSPIDIEKEKASWMRTLQTPPGA